MQLDDRTIVILAAAAAVLVPFVVIAISRKTSQRRLERIGPAFELGTARLAGKLGGAIEGIYRGYTCNYRIEPASQYSPGGAVLRVKAASPIKWSAAVSDAASRMLNRIGFLQDVEIGDQVLDERLRFSSSDPGFLVSALQAPASREALSHLVGQTNFKGLDTGPNHLQAQWRPRNKSLDEDPDQVRGRLDAVVELLLALGIPPAL
ncbi:MAG: hypothetical protein GY906_18385 [bacterium]|nr:hypothetical protein [bacterium]